MANNWRNCYYKGCEGLKHKRAWCAALAAFTLTLAVWGTVVALLVVDVRVGRTLFGEQYAAATHDNKVDSVSADPFSFSWLPARLQVLLKVPEWEAQVLEWLLSSRS